MVFKARLGIWCVILENLLFSFFCHRSCGIKNCVIRLTAFVKRKLRIAYTCVLCNKKFAFYEKKFKLCMVKFAWDDIINMKGDVQT